jgi:arylsulfatase
LKPYSLTMLRSLCWALLLSPFSQANAADAPQTKPNIIVILSDDMGFSDIGCYGGEIATPNLDRLAADGLRFTQFYNGARCVASRASLLTGVYPHQAGIQPGDNERLNDRCVTIAEALQPAGYKNYCVGKWHLAGSGSKVGQSGKHNWPLQRGFDRYYGTIRGASSFFDPGTLTRDNEFISPYADPEYKPDSYYYTDAISDHACRFIKEHPAESPFFMYVAYTAAHWPMHALPEDIAKYQGKYDGGYEPIRQARYKKALELGVIGAESKLSPTEHDWNKVADKVWEADCMEVYAAMVDRMDQGIGKIIATLKQRGCLENTLVLFLHDNGGSPEGLNRKPPKAGQKPKSAGKPMRPDEIIADMIPRQMRDGSPQLGFGPPGAPNTFIAYGAAWANVSNMPFRKYKIQVHEGGIATPLIAHWPQGIKAKNELRRTPSHLIDLMATCLDVAGAAYPATRQDKPVTPLEGKSLVPAFAGAEIAREMLIWEHHGNRAIRVGEWKLVASGKTGEDDVKWELYNMAEDRSELNNLASKHPERVKEMSDLWLKHAHRTNILPWPISGEKEEH